jgi:CIC family chloride channel protein
VAFLALVPLIGVLIGLAALGVSYLIAGVQILFWGGGEDLALLAEHATWKMRVLVPLAGGAAVALLRWALRAHGGGHGTAGIIQALALKGGYVSSLQTLPRAAAGVLTVACGGSLGREGPVIQVAAAAGSRLGRWFGLPPQYLRVLVCCAAASAISAVYNAPIGGTVFAMEILIGNFALEIFGPVVISSVLATAIFRSAMGELPRFVIPAYQLVSAWELPAYVALGVAAGLFSLLFNRVIFLTEDLFVRLRLPQPVKTMIGFTALGGIACWFPQVYGNGYGPTNLTLHDQMPLHLLAVLPFVKLAATALTSGSGGSGGLFTPSMMVGALLGSLFGFGVHGLFPQVTADPGAYAIVGMGGIIAGTTHAPITAVLMIFEQTNSYQVILPLMLVCIMSNLTARAFRGASMHEEQLRRRGVVLPSGPEASVMQYTRVEDVMHEEPEALGQTEPFRRVVERFLNTRFNYLYVVDRDGWYVGAVSLHALKNMLHYATMLDVVIAHDLVDPAFEFVTRKQTLADTMDKFWRQSCERLPVVESEQDRRLVGWVSKRDLIGIYSQEILQKRHLMARFALAEDGQRRDVYVELPEGFELQTLHAGEAAGRTLRELAPMSFGVMVLQVRRLDSRSTAEAIVMPSADAKLLPGDRLLVIGTAERIGQFREALGGVEAAAEAPGAQGRA